MAASRPSKDWHARIRAAKRCRGVATLTLNRPEKLNALSVPLFRDLRRHIDDIASALSGDRVVVLRGAR